MNIDTTLTHDWQRDEWVLVVRQTDGHRTHVIADWGRDHDDQPVRATWHLPPQDHNVPLDRHPGLALPHNVAQAIHRALDAQFAQHTDLAQVTRERDDAVARALDLERDLAIAQVRLNAQDALIAAHHDTLEAQAAHLDREAATVDRERSHVDMLIEPRTLTIPEPRVTPKPNPYRDPWDLPGQRDGDQADGDG